MRKQPPASCRVRGRGLQDSHQPVGALEPDGADDEGVLLLGETEGHGAAALVGAAVVGVDVHRQGDGADELGRRAAVELGLDCVAAARGPADEVDLGAVALGEAAGRVDISPAFSGSLKV